MEVYKKLFKNETAAQARVRRGIILTKTRKDDRMTILNAKRRIEEEKTQVSSAEKENERRERLAKWKANKQKLLAEMKKNKKPAFTAGVLQRKVTGSPLKMSNVYASKNFLNPNQIMKVAKGVNETGVVTRSRHRVLAKANGDVAIGGSSFQKIINNKRVNIDNKTFTVPKSVANLTSGHKITVPESPKVLKGRKMVTKSGRQNNKEIKVGGKVVNNNAEGKTVKQSEREGMISERNTNHEYQKESNQYKRENNDKEINIKESKITVEILKYGKDNGYIDSEAGVKEEIKTPPKEFIQTNTDLSSSTRQIEKSPGGCTPTEEEKTENKDAFLPIYYSPYVKKSRGSNVKSAKKEKITLSLDVDKVIEKEEKQFQCRIFSFRKYIDCQTKRLLDTCEMWTNIMNADPNIPQDAVGEIQCLCGKTNLLTSDKFKQFKGLVDKCENRDPMIKLEDLDGYQDWVSIEVDSLDDAFTKLEQRRKNNWQVEMKEKCQPFKKVAKPAQPKKTIKRPVARSNIRDLIQAARKMKQNESTVGDVTGDPYVEAKSPIKTPRKENGLLKEVLHSEAMKVASPAQSAVARESGFLKSTTEKKKRRNSGLEILIATHLSKSLTPEKSAMRIAVAEEQAPAPAKNVTPGKSILKKTPLSMKLNRSVHFSFSESKKKGPGLDERYFQPVLEDDENSSDISIRMRGISLGSPFSTATASITPLRRSSRLAGKH